MPAPDVVETIRAIFLHREPYVTKQEAAKLLGWSVAQLRIAIAAGDVETYGTCRGERVPLSEIATIARERWQPSMIEQALGDDAAAISRLHFARARFACVSRGTRSPHFNTSPSGKASPWIRSPRARSIC